MKNAFKSIPSYFKSSSNSTKANPKDDDRGRDEWQSRTSYLLASMCGAIGFGNLLRYPSQVFNNNGLQWFIPYFMAVALLAIPVLILEVAIGSSLQGGPVLAWNAMSRRARGVGLGNLWVTSLVCLYYVPMLSWVMRFFRASFESPLPWEGRVAEFYEQVVVANIPPIPATAAEAIDQGVFMSYPGTSIIGQQVGWNAFSWVVIWLCLFNGVKSTGKAVYVTMGLPVIIVIVLIVRSATLPNAIDGIKLYMGEFNADQLAGGQIWQDALGQVFYSTGVGFGYYTAYASYNRKNANAVQDSIIICCSNCLFEIACGFAVFGVVGFLGMTPENTGRVGSFVLGFITLPEGLAQMPGAQVWSVIFFLTLFLLAVSSAFVMTDSVITVICDSDWGQKFRRVSVSTTVIVCGFLISMIYNTQFGSALLDAVDLNTNNIVLPFTVFAECYAATVIYRCVDVIGQCGLPAFVIHQLGFLGSIIGGLALAHMVSVPGGLGFGFGFYFLCFGVSVLISRTPDSSPPGFWARSAYLSRAWWLAAYSGNQLRRDLNVTVAAGKNWPLTWYWPICLRYVSCPVLAIVFSFSYPTFIAARSDPLMIFAFAVGHLAIITIVSLLIFPRWLSPVIPSERREEGKRTYAPQVILGNEDVRISRGVEAGESDGLHGVDGVAEKEADGLSKTVSSTGSSRRSGARAA